MKYKIDEQFKPLDLLGHKPVNRAKLAASNIFLKNFFTLTKRKGGIVYKRYRLKSFDGKHFDTHTFVPREKSDGVTPCLIYFHGGAFNTECSIQHFVVQRLAERLEAKIVLPFYRLAPAYPFPFGFEDCYSTLQWVVRHAEALKVDSGKIAVMGDSAGGNLSAAVCLRNRDENFCEIKFQSLIYPVTDDSMDSPSMQKYVDTPCFNAVLNKEMWEMYLKNGYCGMKDYAVPLRAKSLKNLPPALVELAEFDCLHDQGKAFAQALSAAGNEVTLFETKGTPHGYDGILNSTVAKECMDLRVKLLRQAFGMSEEKKTENE